jgi:hypothetical protein
MEVHLPFFKEMNKNISVVSIHIMQKKIQELWITKS